MKYSNKILLVLVFLSIVLCQISCQKDAFVKANVNPNAPETVLPGNILPVVELSLAYTQGGDLTRYATLFVQQSVGYSRQAAAYSQYILTSTDFDSPWGNMYTSVLGNDRDLMQKSDAGSYNEYSGISRILMAYSLQLLVDEWGKVPYSQAFQGVANTHPVYDDDKALYDTIENLVNIGITQLSNSDAGGLTPGGDDIIYGGDASKWIKFGHAVKARLFIHQSKGDAAMAAKALAEANLSFTDNSDNAQFTFGSTETSANPIYEFNSQRGDIDYGAGDYSGTPSVLSELLASKNDPREFDITATYDTTDQVYTDVNAAGIGDYYGAINGTVEFITYEEIQFIKAEATLRTTGNFAVAQAFYQAGIQASMDKFGIVPTTAAAYVASNGILPATSVDAAIAAVATQEYISLAHNPEAWTLWRRTGAPALTATSGTNGIPRRFLYPQNEYSLNAANVPAASLFSPRIFWDK